MTLSRDLLKEIRERTGAGILDCKEALLQAGGDLERAEALLRERGLAKAARKMGRATNYGIVEAYIHAGGRLGALVEVNCESDFVARTQEFRELAHDLAMQVTATSPHFIGNEDLPERDLDLKEECLLHQPFIKDPTRTVQDVVHQTIAKLGENITVKRFARFELGN